MPRPSTSHRLRLREYIGYGLGDTASNLFFQTFNIFLIYYYTDVWGIPAASIGLMLLLVRLWDAINDPLMGLVCDRTSTRWGKYRPYLLWMAIPYGFFGYLLFANPDLSPGGKLIYAYVTYTLMLMAYTAINVPYSSLLGVLSPSSRSRTIASSFRFVGAFGGGLLITLLVRPMVAALGGGDEVAGFQSTMAIFAVVSVLLFWVTFATTRERVSPPARQKTHVWGEIGELSKNRPWLILLVAAVCSTAFITGRASATIYYFKYVVGDDGRAVLFGTLDQTTVFLSSGMLFMMLGTASVGFISRWADKKHLTVGLTLGTAVCYALFYVLPPENFMLLLAVNSLGAFMLGPTSALVWAMYADVADYGEWKFGRRSTGLVYSASLFALKTGSMIAGTLIGVLLSAFGFVPNAVQGVSALVGINLLFSLIPAAFGVLKALAIAFYPLDQRRVDQIEAELEQRRAVRGE